jgi:hypothetical protein
MIRIFNTPWHVAHQYELYKVPGTEWAHVVNTVRKWGKYRPRPTNLSEVAYYEPGKYDLAVLHIDQQCVDPTFGKSRLYHELNTAVRDIPKIVINHGTPYWPEVYDTDEIIRKMKMLIGDNHVVYNSHEAKKMWEKNGPIGKSARTIIHGMDPDEWWDRPKEPRVVTMLSPAGLDRYYNRRLLSEVQGKLRERGIAHVWVGGDVTFEGFDDYRNFVSRSLIYFNPTLQSPMPRSRTEAMLSGACVVTLPNHGAEDFIKPADNGFHAPNNPEMCAALLENLVRDNYHAAAEIGQRGKETARALFSMERFQNEWQALFHNVTTGKI